MFVQIRLDDSRPDHCHGTSEKSKSDLLDGGEVDTSLAERGVDDHIAKRNQDDEREGVEVRHNIVGKTVGVHDRGLGSKIVVDLVVCEPCEVSVLSPINRVGSQLLELTVKRVPEKHGARLESSTNLVHPLVVKGHPSWSFRSRDLAGLNLLPESTIVHVFVGRHRVD